MFDNQKIIKISHRLADVSGEIARHFFRKTFSFSLKDDASPVTEADLKIETAIREIISQEFPDHAVLGEEQGLNSTGSEYLWVIDPIDGTAAFATGKPLFTTLIALVHKGDSLLGIINQPITHERWLGIKGQPPLYNGMPCRAISQSNPIRISLNCTTPAMLKTVSGKQKFEKLKEHVSMVTYGGDAYAYGLLASGHLDAIFEADLKYHDVAAIIPIINGAGGIITDWEGRAIQRDKYDGTCLAAANRELHTKFLRVINP